MEGLTRSSAGSGNNNKVKKSEELKQWVATARFPVPPDADVLQRHANSMIALEKLKESKRQSVSPNHSSKQKKDRADAVKAAKV